MIDGKWTVIRLQYGIPPYYIFTVGCCCLFYSFVTTRVELSHLPCFYNKICCCYHISESIAIPLLLPLIISIPFSEDIYLEVLSVSLLFSRHWAWLLIEPLHPTLWASIYFFIYCLPPPTLSGFLPILESACHSTLWRAGVFANPGFCVLPP